MTNTLLLPRYDAYGRMLAATEPDAKAHFTMYAVARDEIEQLRQERHQLRNELTAARLALEQLTNGYKFPAECCTIAREALAGAADEPSEVYDKIGVLRPDGEFTTYEGCEGEPVYVRRALKSNPAPETSGGYACMNCAGAGCSDCTPALQSNPPRLPCIYREGCKNYDHCLAAGHCHPL